MEGRSYDSFEIEFENSCISERFNFPNRKLYSNLSVASILFFKCNISEASLKLLFILKAIE